MEDLEDTHFCLRCKATISGLDNYVSHRKQNCLADKQISAASKHPSENLTLDSNINDFFTSLELQSTCTLPKNKADDLDEEDAHQFSEEDEYFPPRTHTGGKWTPGTRPDLTNEQFSSNPISSANPNEQPLGKKTVEITKSNEAVDTSKIVDRDEYQNESQGKKKVSDLQNETEVSHTDSFNCNQVTDLENCQRCGMTFETKKDFAVHQFSSGHKEKFVGSGAWLEDTMLFQRSLLNLFPYHCNLCRRYYLHCKDLNVHARSREHQEKVEGKSHFCLPCHHKCRTSTEMIAHLASAVHKRAEKKIRQSHPVIVISKNLKIICSLCPKQQCLLSKQKEETLFSSRPSASAIKCSECSKYFENDVEHDKHLLLEHPDCRCCKPCNVVFQSAVLLCNHLHTKAHKKKLSRGVCNSGTFVCSLCHFCTNSEGEFLVHKIQHDEPRTINKPRNGEAKKAARKLLCPICKKTFFLSALRNHIFSHTGERNFVCNVCSKSFSQKGSLALHMNIHQENKSYSCKQCDFKTLHRSALWKHTNVHKTDLPKSFLCDVCGVSYKSQSSLYQHALGHGDLKYKCQYQSCFYAFRTPSELATHAAVHSDDRPYLCDTCGFAVKSPHQLKKHQRQHTKEKPFKCKYCSYSSTLSSNILRHLRLHSGSKPYKCPYCEYKCNTQENIRKHILKTKKHAGKLMYPCKHCSFGCNEFQRYKIHLLENHREHYPAGEKDIESSVITGLYVKDKLPTAIEQGTETSPVVDSSGGDVLSALTPMILGSEAEVVNEIVVTTDVCETRNSDKDLGRSQIVTCAENSGELCNAIFIYQVCSYEGTNGIN